MKTSVFEHLAHHSLKNVCVICSGLVSGFLIFLSWLFMLLRLFYEAAQFFCFLTLIKYKYFSYNSISSCMMIISCCLCFIIIKSLQLVFNLFYNIFVLYTFYCIADKSVSFEKSVSFSDEPPDMNSPKQHSPQHGGKSYWCNLHHTFFWWGTSCP